MRWKILLASYLLIAGLCFSQRQIDSSTHSFPSIFDSDLKRNDLESFSYSLIDYLKADPVHHFKVAEHQFQNAWRKPTSDNEYEAWELLLANLAYYAFYTGNVVRSIDLYEQCYQLYKLHPSPDALDIVENVLKPLGNNYTRLGDYERALYIQQQSLLIAREKNDLQEISSIYCNMAISALNKDDFSDAVRWSLTGMKTVRPNSSLNGLLLNTLADIYFHLNHQDSAKHYNQRAILALAKAPDRKSDESNYWLLSAYRLGAQIEMSDKKYNASLLLNLKALGVADNFFKSSRRREKAQVLIETAELYRLLDNLNQASLVSLNAIKTLIPEFEDQKEELPDRKLLFADYTLADALEEFGRVSISKKNYSLALDALFLSFYIDRQLNKEFFSIASKQLHQQQLKEKAELGIGLAFQLWKSSGQQQYAAFALKFAEQAKSQVLLEEIMRNLHLPEVSQKDSVLEEYLRLQKTIAFYDEQLVSFTDKSEQYDLILKQKEDSSYRLSLLQKQLVLHYPALHPAESSASTDVYRLVQDIPTNVEVLEWFEGNTGYYIFQITNEGIKEIKFIPDSNHTIRGSIKNFVVEYFQNGPEKMQNAPSDYLARAYQVFEQLGGPTTFDRYHKKYLLIIPDGGLGYLPFEALITKPVINDSFATWPYLMADGPIWYTYSIDTWQSIQQKKDTEKKKFSGFFISKFPGGATLKAVEKEQQLFGKYLKGEIFSNENCSLNKFEGMLLSSNVVHISTHAGFFTRDSIPGLQLSDARFFIFRLNGLRYTPDLITLSACQTGTGMLKDGEGILSLARGFAATGTKGIVAGLWNVNDVSSAELMLSFYNHLLKGENTINALHDARIDWLKNEKHQNQLALPYYWAGLSYFGAIQQPVLQQKKSNWWLWASIILIIPAIFLIRTIIKRA